MEPLEDRRMLATFSVTNLNDAGAGSLRESIVSANNQPGVDDIVFASGLFTTPQTISLGSSLPTITEGLTITGPGHELLTLDARHGTDQVPGTGDGFRHFEVNDDIPANVLNVTISGLTLTGGDVSGFGVAAGGGAILSRENLSIFNTVIVGNATGPGMAGSQGAPGQDGGNGGRGGDGGGIFSSGGTLTITGSTITGNTTGRGGNGGKGGDGVDDFDGFSGGDGGDGGNGGYGGGIFSDGGSLTITSSTISGNATGGGGTSGAAGKGGNAYVNGINGAGGRGGDGGYGGNGGGIYSSVGMITITSSTISGNTAGAGTPGAAGGTAGIGGTSGNGGDGGDGGKSGSGGGIYSVEGSLTITRSTLSGNRTSSGGAGGSGGSGDINGNVGYAGSDGNGGGIHSLGNDPFLIENTIIAANLTSGQAPDVHTGTASLVVNYSLLGIGDNLQISSGVSNQIGTTAVPIDPLLGPLDNNGGPTRTHALLSGSPAIDTGDPNILFNAGEFDQRGGPYIRVWDGQAPTGAVIDIGAFELQPAPSADFDQDNDVDGADFLRWQRGFDISAGAQRADGNSDNDGDVDAVDLAFWETDFGAVAAPHGAPIGGGSEPGTTRLARTASPSPSEFAITSLALTKLKERRTEPVSENYSTVELHDAAFTALGAINDTQMEITATSSFHSQSSSLDLAVTLEESLLENVQ